MQLDIRLKQPNYLKITDTQITTDILEGQFIHSKYILKTELHPSKYIEVNEFILFKPMELAVRGSGGARVLICPIV